MCKAACLSFGASFWCFWNNSKVRCPADMARFLVMGATCAAGTVDLACGLSGVLTVFTVG